MRVYLIDDEPLYQKMLQPVLKKAGHELGYAKTGEEGLANLKAYNPDVVILDLRLTDMTGFEIMERLRRDPYYRNIPVIFVTSQDELDNKLKAFDMGAEDYLIKPFQPEELAARLNILARRREALRLVESATPKNTGETCTMVAVHSLRGGVGCTSLSVNLALAFHEIWMKPTIAVDTVLTAGQVAMMLNATPAITWEYVSGIDKDNPDDEMVQKLAIQDKSGLSYIASPRFPISFEFFTDLWAGMIQNYRVDYDFIVVDMPHDFSDPVIKTLDVANHILFVMSPEMASLRAAVCALHIYDRLGYPSENIKIILNNTLQTGSFKQAQIEKALGRPVDMVLPYMPAEVIRAINFGEPFVLSQPDLPISAMIEDMAYSLSNAVHKNIPPASPSAAWKRVQHRLPKP